MDLLVASRKARARAQALVQALAVQLALVLAQLQQAQVVDAAAHAPMCNLTICGHSSAHHAAKAAHAMRANCQHLSYINLVTK